MFFFKMLNKLFLDEALCLCVFAFLFLQAKILLFYLQCLILSLRLLHAFTQMGCNMLTKRRLRILKSLW